MPDLCEVMDCEAEPTGFGRCLEHSTCYECHEVGCADEADRGPICAACISESDRREEELRAARDAEEYSGPDTWEEYRGER